MRRSRISSKSKERAEWLKVYGLLRDCQTPEQCFRCRCKGRGWTHLGGDFEAHHPYRRDSLAALCCFFPLCKRCHQEVEHEATKAREDGWIINPRRP